MKLTKTEEQDRQTGVRICSAPLRKRLSTVIIFSSLSFSFFPFCALFSLLNWLLHFICAFLHKVALIYKRPLQRGASLLANNSQHYQLDVTCYVRLHTLLHVVACCWELSRKVWNQSSFLRHANRRNIGNCCVRLHVALRVSCGVSKAFSRLCSGELYMLRHNESYRESESKRTSQFFLRIFLAQNALSQSILTQF